jgi:2-polyprenyl-6-methoxyphenol hydroxylase-like FAD-dependent oxidoreductase
MPESYDLIVVGGGLGGSSLAMCMAKSGAQVLVLERAQQFKDRVRGEFMTPWGVAEAKRLGILELLRDECAHEVPWVDLYSGNVLTGHRPVVPTTPHQLPCLSFYHPAMQELLIGAAASARANVRRGASVRDVRPGSPVTVVAGDNGHSEEIHARLVVGADGRSSTLRASVDFQLRRDSEDMLVAGVLMDNVGAPEDIGQIVMNSSLGQAAIVFPQGRGRVRTYLGFHTGTQPRYQGTADLPRYIDACKKTGMNPAFYDGAKAAGPLATFDGAEVWVEHPFKDGEALIGDAAAASDPSWGQGLSLTLRDARVLRDHLLATNDWETAGHAYAKEHDRYTDAVHTSNLWHTEFFLATGPQADARRARALPLIEQDHSRQLDTLFSGPEVPVNEAVRKGFFAED